MWHEARRIGWLISTDPGLVDLDVVHGFLSTCYWSRGIPRATVARAIEHSIPFGIYEVPATGPSVGAAARRMAGFARVITDRATFAYLADVFVLESDRGRGLSTWLMEAILAHSDLQGLRRFCLMTRDAHGLYARYGFKPLPDPAGYMERLDREVCSRS